MTPYRIACDLDGCLVNFNDPMWQLLTMVGAPMRPFDGADPECWDWYCPYGAQPTHLNRAYAAMTGEWWRTLPRHRDFTERTAAHLQRLNHQCEVTFVTNRPTRQPSVFWLHHHVDRDCHVVVTPGSKVPTLVGLRPDAVVEDRVETLVDFANMVSGALLLLVDRAYNRHVHDARIIRVPTTLDAFRHIEAQLP